jgi:hypothetical protein
MATKQFYATRDFKYGTRMMRAGDAVEMTGPDSRLYKALGAISPEKPRRAAAPKPDETETTETATAPKARKRTTRTRKAKK